MVGKTTIDMRELQHLQARVRWYRRGLWLVLACAYYLLFALWSGGAFAAEPPPESPPEPPPPWLLETWRPESAAVPLVPAVPPLAKPAAASPRSFDAQYLVAAVSDCWPAPSLFRPELSLELRGGRKFGDVSPTDQTQANYAGLVAKIPLYSPTELDRQREHEAKRQGEAAAAAGAIVQALAERARAARETQLYEALERRSRQRVFEGVADTDEQVGALRRVADAHTRAADASAKLTAAKLSLLAMCQRGARADAVAAYLQKAGI